MTMRYILVAMVKGKKTSQMGFYPNIDEKSCVFVFILLFITRGIITPDILKALKRKNCVFILAVCIKSNKNKKEN